MGHSLATFSSSRSTNERFNNNSFMTREKLQYRECSALLLNLKGTLNSGKEPDPLKIFTARLFTVGNISKEKYKLFLFSFSLANNFLSFFFLYKYIYIFFLHANKNVLNYTNFDIREGIKKVTGEKFKVSSLLNNIINWIRNSNQSFVTITIFPKNQSLFQQLITISKSHFL